MATVIEGDFEWDEDKAASNIETHGVSFPEAATAFADPQAVYLDDGSRTDRIIVIGTSVRNRPLRRSCRTRRAGPHHQRQAGHSV